MIRHLLAAVATAMLVGCGTSQQSAIATVSASQASLTAAGRVILACYSVPACSSVAPKPQIKTAFDVAYLAVTTAQGAADKGGTPDMAAVMQALQALQALVASLPRTS
jgi:hypothetical protein